MSSTKKISAIVLIMLAIALSVFRLTNVHEKEISWDVLGYYMHLPATFIYDDPLLDDPTWLHEINEEKDLSGTLYQISYTDDWDPLYLFLMGMALFYLPFFFLGHGAASILDYPMDGFSMPYQYALVIGGIIYTLIGLFYLRKILKHYFNDKIVALVIILIALGTNYVHHMSIKNLETVNVLFMLASILIWNTLKWHKNQRIKYLFGITVSATLMLLIKPSEFVIIILPVLWGVYSKSTLKSKFKLIWQKRYQFMITIAVSILIAAPQMLYWYAKTGSIIYLSYRDPAVGLDFLSSHTIEALFGYRKGWLIYTPLMIFSLIGFRYLFKFNRKIFWGITIYFLVSLYVITSWTEYWYGAGFSNRPLIVVYPVLAICLGYLLKHLSSKKLIVKSVFTVLILFCVFLNQFQWWQLRNWILDTYRTSKEYYWATFLKTSKTWDDEAKKLVYRDFSGAMNFQDSLNQYSGRVFEEFDFSDKTDNKSVILDGNNAIHRLTPDEEYSIGIYAKFKKLTKKDHVWVKASLKFRFRDSTATIYPVLVTTMDHKGKAYGYYAPDIKMSNPDENGWYTYTQYYLTPEIRNTSDNFSCYVWNRSKIEFDIDNFRLEVFERKDIE